MPQQTFAEVTFEQYRKHTSRERFLDEMNYAHTRATRIWLTPSWAVSFRVLQWVEPSLGN
jgi:hypothetical protein